jgi:hypothetical protein
VGDLPEIGSGHANLAIRYQYHAQAVGIHNSSRISLFGEGFL